MNSPQFQKKPCRPRDSLAVIGRQYPEAWKQADMFRADRGQNGIPHWPDWCYLPLSAWYAIVSGGGSARLGLEMVGDVARLGALGAWRATQGIYRFDPDLYAAIVDTPVAGDIPHDVLYRLPEWCVYVETPGASAEAAGGEIFGFYAHLEHDTNTGRPELRLLLDCVAGMVPVPLYLGPWPLAESISRMVDVSNIDAFLSSPMNMPHMVRVEIKTAVEPLVSLLLYLCAENSEIGDGTRAPANPAPKRTKAGWRMFPAEKPTTWDVGVRIGAALRRAASQERGGDGTGEHAGPRPHIRRAHWHGFRSGPMKDKAGDPIPAAARRFDVRWMPPIPVNVEDTNDLVGTIHAVKGSPQ